jgi:hypothetical protein
MLYSQDSPSQPRAATEWEKNATMVVLGKEQTVPSFVDQPSHIF